MSVTVSENIKLVSGALGTSYNPLDPSTGAEQK